MRRFCSLLCLAIAGCQSLGSGDVYRGAIGPCQLLPSSLQIAKLREDPRLPKASEAIERGDYAAACDLLRAYANHHPESKGARAFYAEVLAKLGKNTEAMIEFETAVARLQEDKSVDLAMIVHCHGRLLDLADTAADDYHVRLHRGLGLYWLAQQKRTAGEADDAVPTESILFKAAMELTAAHSLEPEQARPVWYLHLIWRHLGQSAPAERWLNAAREACRSTYLTPHEMDELQLAGGVK